MVPRFCQIATVEYWSHDHNSGSPLGKSLRGLEEQLDLFGKKI